MAGSMQSEEMPGYFAMISKAYKTCEKYFETSHVILHRYPYEFVVDMWKYADTKAYEIAFVTVLAVIMTLLRSALTKNVFMPFAKHVQMTSGNAEKFPESAWKFLYYCFAWGLSVYILLVSQKYDYFYKPLGVWADWEASMYVPLDIRIAYAVQFAFYMHSVYATLYMDHWRKDSIVMIFHHFLTMALIGFSYAVRYHKIGMLVLFVHDLTDIWLEMTKCNVYLKRRRGGYYPVHDHCSTVGFILFALTWFVFRLFLFPLKVLHAAGYGRINYGPDPNDPNPPFVFFFNVMLWILQGLNIYWFMFIIKLMYKVATGQMKEVDDVREEEVVAKHSTKQSPKEHPHVNGNGSVPVSNGAANHHKSNGVQNNHNHERLKDE